MKKKWRAMGLSLLVSIGIWLCASLILVNVDKRKSASIEPGSDAYLASLDEKDVASISNIVKKADKEIQLGLVDSLEDELRIRFSDAVFLGDSIVEGISEYRLLGDDHVIAQRGRRTDNSEDDVQMAIALAPRQVFLLYGMNDLEYCRGDAQRYIEQYRTLIDTIQINLPDTDIYVSAILPIQEKAMREKEVFRNYTDFNQALNAMCEEEQLHFLDMGYLLTSSDDYEFDGIHPKYDFYPLWLSELAKEAGL